MCVFMVLDCHLFNDTKLQNNFHICKYLHEYFKEKVEIILNEFSVLFKHELPRITHALELCSLATEGTQELS